MEIDNAFRTLFDSSENRNESAWPPGQINQLMKYADRPKGKAKKKQIPRVHENARERQGSEY